MREAGGTPGPAAGAARAHGPPPVSAPFGRADAVEHTPIRAVDVGGAGTPPQHVAFLDGIQRWAVEGHFGLVPVVRAYAAAAVLRREGGALRAVAHEAEECLVAALDRLPAAARRALEGVGLPLYDCGPGERPHPVLDLQLAVQVVEQRRETLETAVARRYLGAAPDGWLVVDGSLGAIDVPAGGRPRLIGLVKTHETQFLDGRDLEVALTLPVGHRTSVFAPGMGRGAHGRVVTWYLRLWLWHERELLYGLVRVERPAASDAVQEATPVSRWLLAERAPLATPDGRWDRLIYPIRQVETYLRAQAGGWW